jgi:hypothetical protein
MLPGLLLVREIDQQEFGNEVSDEVAQHRKMEDFEYIDQESSYRNEISAAEGD